jgi:citrate lyase subunit beta/citryl-CoA lyase
VTLDPALARSLLFVPGDRPDRFGKAHGSEADVVVLDLEDGVDPAERGTARGHVRNHLGESGPPSLVRLSAAAGDDLVADLAAIGDRPRLAGVVVPKADDPGAVEAVVGALPPGTAVVLLVETAAGVLAAGELARVAGVTRLALGTVDLEVDTGISQDADVLRSVRVGLTLASRAAGLPGPIDGVTTDLADPAATEVAATEAQRAGFSGKLCIHPRQVSPVNAVFSPSPEAVLRAERIVAAAGVHGAGAFRLDGQMVDAPVIQRARALLARATAVSSSAAGRIR